MAMTTFRKTRLYRLVLALGVLALLLTDYGVARADEQIRDLILRQFREYDPDYDRHREYFGQRLEEMSEALARAQSDGHNLYCSEQMYLEAKWLHRYTAHWARIEDKLQRIEESLSDRDQEFAREQSPVTGMWGACYEAWFMQLGATISELERLALTGEPARYEIRPTGQIKTGKRLIDLLQDLLVSDIANTGVNNRGELGSLMTSFSQAAFKTHIREMLLTTSGAANPENTLAAQIEAFRFFLDGSQDRETGYWGAWYIDKGRVHKALDLSMTYHIVAYLEGDVPRWPSIIETTMAIENERYPFGWLHNGRHNNHNLYDVAKILKFGWPHMDDEQRATSQEKIDWMIRWSLENTLTEDNKFIHDPSFSDSLADEYYFGVSLYDVVGLWNEERRFWTKRPIEYAAAPICCQIKQEIEQSGWDGWAAEGALNKLERNCGAC
jgi:hypothetical protein